MELRRWSASDSQLLSRTNNIKLPSRSTWSTMESADSRSISSERSVSMLTMRLAVHCVNDVSCLRLIAEVRGHAGMGGDKDTVRVSQRHKLANPVIDGYAKNSKLRRSDCPRGWPYRRSAPDRRFFRLRLL